MLGSKPEIHLMMWRLQSTRQSRCDKFIFINFGIRYSEAFGLHLEGSSNTPLNEVCLKDPLIQNLAEKVALQGFILQHF